MTEKNATWSFTFGDPEPVTDYLEQLGVFYDPFGNYYTPPVSMKGLDTLTRANAVHRRCLNFKVDQMAIAFVQNKIMSLRDFRRAARDLETFGNVYLKAVRNGFGQILRLTHIPAINMRKSKNNAFVMLLNTGISLEFKAGEVLHSYHYDTGQTIYGLPEWIASMHDIFLNSEATLFRRRYYLNGSHLGYIFYSTDPNLDKEVEKKLTEAIARGKGVGNFKSMFINIPNGKEKGIQIIPVGDISQKDEFEKIKRVSADDIIIGHGIQPLLAGMKPDNVGGFGDIEKMNDHFKVSHLPALVQPFLEINDELPAKLQFEFTL